MGEDVMGKEKGFRDVVSETYCPSQIKTGDNTSVRAIWQRVCYGMNCVLPNSQAKVLAPSTSENNSMWREVI